MTTEEGICVINKFDIKIWWVSSLSWDNFTTKKWKLNSSSLITLTATMRFISIETATQLNLSLKYFHRTQRLNRSVVKASRTNFVVFFKNKNIHELVRILKVNFYTYFWTVLNFCWSVLHFTLFVTWSDIHLLSTEDNNCFSFWIISKIALSHVKLKESLHLFTELF